MPSVLLFTTTTGYQARAFEDAARRLGVRLIYATDRCKGLDDPWRDHAIAVRFHDLGKSVRAIVDATVRDRPAGVIALGDRPAVLAAHAASALGLPFHPPHGAEVAASKLLTRGRLLAHDLPGPWFASFPSDTPLHDIAERVRLPCVLKPVALSASRGVMRADSPEQFVAALARLRAILADAEVRAEKNPAHDEILVEGFVPGLEYALEGVMEAGALRVFAIFAKPDPLDGPFFEETIYVTPPGVPEATAGAIASTIASAALAMGLHHGPVHAECRVNEFGVFVLEIAARPIGGLCARALRFLDLDAARANGPAGNTGSPGAALSGALGGAGVLSLEELLLRHALGESLAPYAREGAASAVMMVPVPGRGRYRRTDGIEAARAVPGVDEVVIAAKDGQMFVPLPEGHSYPGFIFARGALPEDAVRAVRAAHAQLHIVLDTALPLTPSYLARGGT
jgi:hypothetical protein